MHVYMDTHRSCDDHVEACGDSAEVGYEMDLYTPEAHESLAEAYETTLIEGDDVDQIDGNSSVDCSLYYGKRTMIMAKALSALEQKQTGSETNSSAPSITTTAPLTSYPTPSPTNSWEWSGGSKSWDNSEWDTFAPTASGRSFGETEGEGSEDYCHQPWIMSTSLVCVTGKIELHTLAQQKTARE